MQQATQGLASSNSFPLLFCMFFFASLHDAFQSVELLCRWHNDEEVFNLQQKLGFSSARLSAWCQGRELVEHVWNNHDLNLEPLQQMLGEMQQAPPIRTH